ncbi:MAG: hypothetical protein K2M47_02120 [Clostridiales bacterium]|nr:hypothetical protein [Clostridiales bacterium]
MQKANINKFSARIRAAVAVTLIAAIAVMSAGCSYFRDLFKPDVIRFTESKLELYVGEMYDISRVLETNTTSYRLSSSDSSVVSVNRLSTVVTATAVGMAYVTAETSYTSDRIKVEVTEREDDSLTISANGELVQTFGRTSEITFTVSATGEPSGVEYVYWCVNGAHIETLTLSDEFEFTPSEIGEYAVIAQCGDFYSDEITVRVCSAVTAEVSVTGELEQNEPFDNIVFSVAASGDTDDIYFQYFEDGKVLYEGMDSTYVYSPTVGRHTLTVKVNGQTEYSEDVCFRGAVLPIMGDLEFDNLYPHAYIEYEAIGNVKVEIMFPQGSTVEYSQNDTQYAELFDENGFDVGSLIDLCATGSNRQEYKFRVKSLGDGDAVTESGYSDYVTFTQLPSNAKQYITNVLPCGDLYVTSAIEYVRITEYYIYFRQKEANSSVSFDCYLGYDRSGSAVDLWNSAFPIAATSGTYTGIKVNDLGGDVMRTSFKVSTVNSPSTQTIASAQRSAQLHAILPHINYDAAKNRPSNYKFAIDSRTRTAEVEYSDELYLAAQNGVRPIPKAGSSAQAVYEQARNVLRSICTDDMTDVQKAHAIYDWIMWHVTYDTPATMLSSGGESYSAYYLEAVFGNGSTKFGGVAYNPNAVCDGMSKAYTLMCNMEGIPCVRVVGRAGKSLREAGGHAWNKVYLDGAWYVVDCTWGDSHITLALDGAAREYELGLHSYLFVTDAQVSATHFEPYEYDDNTTIMYAPQTAKSPINVFADMTVNGVEINCYIAKTEIQKNRVSEIATAFARAYVKNKTISVPLSGEHAVGYQAIEIYADGGFTLSDNEIATYVTTAVKSVHRTADVKTFSLEESVLVLIKV